MKNRNKNKKINATNDKLQELYNILDKRYFHISIQFKHGNIEWSVYYKNLPTATYFHKRNIPILTSKKNTIKDIYELKDLFETEKKKEINQNIKEISNISYATFVPINYIKRKYIEILSDLMFLIATANLFNIFVTKNLEFSILSLGLIVLFAILNYIKQRKINEKIENCIDEIQEIYIAEKIKRQGIYFIKRLKDEF